jgi:hypothetical protein
LRIARDTSIGVSGRCDFTSASDRSSASSFEENAAISRGHRIPASRVVTIARNAPLVEAGWREISTYSEKAKVKSSGKRKFLEDVSSGPLTLDTG